MWRHTTLRRWLLEGRRFNASTAAAEFQVSRRTIMDDLEYLRSYGYQFEYDRGRNSYVLTERSGEMPTLQLRRSEWAAILMAQHVFETLGAHPVADAMERITDRVRALMPDMLGIDPAEFSPALALVKGPSPEFPLPFLTDLSRAIEDQLTVRMTYFTRYRGKSSERLVNPYRVLSRDGRGYLVGWCHTRSDVLIFRLDRIQSLEVTGSVFLVPDGFNLEEFLGPMFGMFKEKTTFEVKIRFSPFVAPWIREEIWHRSQKMTDLADGSVQVDMNVTGLPEVKKWVLGFGSDAEVVEPQHLRRAVQYEVEKMAVLYG